MPPSPAHLEWAKTLDRNRMMATTNHPAFTETLPPLSQGHVHVFMPTYMKVTMLSLSASTRRVETPLNKRFDVIERLLVTETNRGNVSFLSFLWNDLVEENVIH
jgi:hypothetical protein